MIPAFIRIAAVVLVAIVPSAEAADWSTARYMENLSCKILGLDDALVHDFPIVRPYIEAGNKGGVPVKSCTYLFMRGPGKTNPQYGWVVLSDPPPAILDSWITTACRKGAPRQTPRCVDALTRHIAKQSGGQFPVVGFVAEGPDGELCVQYDKPVELLQHGKSVALQGLIAFEDGVTVQRAANPAAESDDGKLRKGIYCATDGWGPEVQKQISKNHVILEVFKKARLSGLDRNCGKDFIRAAEARTATGDADKLWLLASRFNHLMAIETGIDEMMVRQAQRFAAGKSLEGKCS
jgi:hypothetical protein